MRAILALLLLATPLSAGPWPRERGAVYWLFQHEPGHDWSSLYAEWGGPFGLTFGLDAGGHAVALARDEPGAVAARVFVRTPLGPRDGPWRFAMENGVGVDALATPWGTAKVAYTTLGVAVGRGLRWRERDGWLSVDLKADLAMDRSLRYRGGAKLGWKPTRRDTVELSVDGTSTAGEARWTAGPTYERRIGPLGLRGSLRRTERGDTIWRLGVTGTF